MLVLDITVIFRLKILKAISIEDANKKIRQFLYIRGRAILITTGSNLCDIKYEFYGFNDDLRDTMN